MTRETESPTDAEWFSDVEREMLSLYAIDSADAGWSKENMEHYRETGLSPREFVLWYGEKYGLVNVSSFLRSAYCRK